MKILQVTDFYPPVLGGLERYVQLVSHELSRRGHQVAIATLTEAADDQHVRVHTVKGWSRALERFYKNSTMNFHPTVPDPGVVRALQRVIDDERPDVINVHSWISHSLLSLRSLHGAKVVMTLHDYGVVCAKKTFIHSPLQEICSGPGLSKCYPCASAQYGRAVSTALVTGLFASAPLRRRIDRFIAVGSSVAVAGRMAGNQAVTVIPGFVPDAAFDVGKSPDRRPAGLPEHDGYVLFVGTLAPHKGVDVLIEARRHFKAPLVLIGSRRHDTPDIPDDVIVLTDMAHEDVMTAWKHAAVGVVPSRWAEPFGLVAVEAMVAGTPVVASATGALPDIVEDGVTGLLVPPGDRDALGLAIQRLLSDTGTARAMGSAARERAQQFRLSTVATQIEDLYTELVTP